MKKIVVFQLSHNTTPNQDKLRRFSSSVRGPKKAGEVRDTQRLGKASVEEADLFIHVSWDANF